MAYGFNGTLRLIGIGADSELASSGYYDITPPTVGTPVYDATGNPIAGRAWRAQVPNDRMNQLGDPGSQFGSIAAAAVVDLGGDEGLWWKPNAAGPTGGVWHLIGYAAGPAGGFRPGINWIKVAHRHSASPDVAVFGGRKIAPGDLTLGDMTQSAVMSRIRTSVQSIARGTAMITNTPTNLFAGAAANGVLTSASGTYIKWVTPLSYVGISDGWSSAMGSGMNGSGTQYTQLVMPPAGTAIPVAGTAGVTRVVDAVYGIPLAAWEALYYVPHTYTGGANSVAAGWVVGSYEIGRAHV